MTENLPFYNSQGEIEYFPGYPLLFRVGDWSPSTNESVSTEQQSLVDEISRILRKPATESHIRALGSNLVGKWIHPITTAEARRQR